jgi:hypothetical protein
MYLIQIDHITYTKSNGELFTLAECWRELEGCGNAHILSENGRVVLRNAGRQTQRRLDVRQAYRNKRLAV